MDYTRRDEALQQTILKLLNQMTDNGIKVVGGGAGGSNVDTSDLAKELTLQDIESLVNLLANTVSGTSIQSLVRFVKDNAVTNVIEDLVTPANNVPLPVKLTSATGPINITAGDLNVHLSHAGANYDSTRIGNGTNLMAVNADGSINVNTTISATRTHVRNINGSVTPVTYRSGASYLLGWNIINPNSYPVYVKLYNTLTPTVGVTTPLKTLMIPPIGSVVETEEIHAFSTAISIAVTKNMVDTDSTAIDTNLIIEITYTT